MMESYPNSQTYHMYDHPQWSDDLKPAFSDHEHDGVPDERPSASATPADLNAFSESRRPSMFKMEDEFSPVDQAWHDRRQESQPPMRHHSQPHPGQQQPYMRVDPNFAASYAQPPPPSWAMSHSGTSTPTPAYSFADNYGQSVQYAGPVGFPGYPADPSSAVSMSPQSSQGGWASVASTDSSEQRCRLQSPVYRPVSPQLVLRPDGIRKKNARFEIPKERNLQTIDALILASTDENEKKELKQQKRLLRNRQAALDSRQRKKSHTEKLEQEKKVHEKRMVDYEDNITQMEASITHEREQWMHQRNQYELAIRQIQHERDEAIRSKTLETADLRRKINLMQDHFREAERQQHRPTSYNTSSDLHNMATDFSEFGFEEDWDHEFSLIGGDDLKMDEPEPLQRQATPKPPPAPIKSNESKTDTGFLNAFYMCLLFGAFIASTSNSASDSKSTATALPALAEPYRAEAGNVLKAVLASGPESFHELLPSQSESASGPRSTISGSELSQMARGSSSTASTMDKLSNTLTVPTRHQQLQQAFSMSASSYNHIVNPLGELDTDAEADLDDSPKPTRLEQAFADLQAKQKQKERAAGLVNKADERSILMERVPEQVLKDFKELVRQTNAGRNFERVV